jgi:hypothetical protein
VDISSFAAVEVVIGLSFLFFLLSTACSAIQEMLSSVLGWRAKTLEDAVATMLGNPKVKRGVKEWFGGVDKKGVVDQKVVNAHTEAGVPADLATAVFEHWRIKGLVRDPNSVQRRRSRPSYLPPRALSLAIAETLALHAPPPPKQGETAPKADVNDTPWARTDAEILAAVQAAVAKLPGSTPRHVLQKAAVNAHGELEGFRKLVERAFDDSMERASGWYKRKAQVVLAVLAVIFAIGLNVDSVRIANHLYNDEAVRTAVVNQARSGDPAQAAEVVSNIEQLQLPFGWSADNRPSGLKGWVGTIAGWLITIAALLLGAPFWFDVLSRLSRQRAVGIAEKPGRPLSDKAAVDVDDDDAAARQTTGAAEQTTGAAKKTTGATSSADAD